jgi:hypothetical protein
MSKLFFIVILFSLLSFQLSAQSPDSLKTTKPKADTLKPLSKTKNDSIVKKHSPKKAAIMSAIIPGLGQFYNRKYWKPPVLYAGFAGFAYTLSIIQDKYKTYHTAYKYRVDNDTSTQDDYIGIYTDDNLKTLQARFHRTRDLLIVGISALYVMNIIDASVDAHLYYFDVTDDLSLKIQPHFENILSTKQTLSTGFLLTLKF